MSLNSTPSASRCHIGIFGKTNAGKSSLINALTNQDTAIVSSLKGTTTDPVSKAMEILPLGPVVITDTPGIDDLSELGKKRIEQAKKVLNKTDLALIVADAQTGITQNEKELISEIEAKKIQYIIVYNKSDLCKSDENNTANEIYVSALNGTNISDLREKIAELGNKNQNNRRIVGDLINPRDYVVLVIPIDSAAPKGRLILPQQQTIRDILDSNAVPVICQNTELEYLLSSLGKKPALVICDSQVFQQTAAATADDIPLTSFSILFARYKGNLETLVKDVSAVEKLKDGDKVLISEGCTHHRQCDDIGTVKIPHWLKEYTGKNIITETSSGGDFPSKLSDYKLIIHCGGCMLNEKQMHSRMEAAKEEGIPIVNYGILISYLKGILKRSVKSFPEIYKML